MDSRGKTKEKKKCFSREISSFEVLFSNTEPLFQPYDLTLDKNSIWKIEDLPNLKWLSRDQNEKFIKCENTTQS